MRNAQCVMLNAQLDSQKKAVRLGSLFFKTNVLISLQISHTGIRGSNERYL